MSTERSMETKLLKSLRPRYEQEGFKFIIEPGADDLPAFLRRYRPDAIARPDAGGQGLFSGWYSQRTGRREGSGLAFGASHSA